VPLLARKREKVRRGCARDCFSHDARFPHLMTQDVECSHPQMRPDFVCPRVSSSLPFRGRKFCCRHTTAPSSLVCVRV
jgi:hypothetical protein